MSSRVTSCLSDSRPMVPSVWSGQALPESSREKLFGIEDPYIPEDFLKEVRLTYLGRGPHGHAWHRLSCQPIL